MTDDCFWIEETGCFEVCASVTLPDLPDAFVFIDSTPAAPDPHSRALQAGAGAARMEIVASPELIVAVFNTSWGDPGYNDYSSHSYLVCVSDDHGFTFSEGIDKYPWQLGGANWGGYDSNYQYHSQQYQWHGVCLAYDQEADNFFAIDNTLNDEGDTVAKLRVSISTDGVSWTFQLVTDINHHAIFCDAYNGTLYYIGMNFVDSWDLGNEDAKISLRYSLDGGATWGGPILGNGGSFQPWDNANRYYNGCSASAAGLHVYSLAYDGNDTNLNYIRPTSPTTWDAPVILETAVYFDYQLDSTFIFASTARPNEVYIGMIETSTATQPYLEIHRSTDSGLNWAPKFTAWIGDLDFELDYGNQGTRNMVRMVELDDGRLVLVMMGTHSALPSNGDDKFAYAVNEDGLASGFGPYTILRVDDIAIDDTYFANFDDEFVATNKGNDVVLSWCNDQGSPQPMRTLVFRP